MYVEYGYSYQEENIDIKNNNNARKLLMKNFIIEFVLKSKLSSF